MAGPRAALYQTAAFKPFRDLLARFEPDRPERLGQAYFQGAEPVQLLYDQIEQLWAGIADHDDWTAFHTKIADIRAAGAAWRLG
jgi:hypothetical protein